MCYGIGDVSFAIKIIVSFVLCFQSKSESAILDTYYVWDWSKVCLWVLPGLNVGFRWGLSLRRTCIHF